VLQNGGWYNIMHPFLGLFMKLRRATISLIMSVCPSIHVEQLGSHWFSCHEILYLSIFFESLFRKFNFHRNLTRIMGTLHEKKCTFLSYSAHFFLEWDMFQTKVVEKIKTHFMFNNFFFPQNGRHLWDNLEKYCTAGQGTDDCVAHCIACWIPKATDTHSEYIQVDHCIHGWPRPPQKIWKIKKNKQFISLKMRAKREQAVTWWNIAAQTRPVLDLSYFVPVPTLPSKLAAILLLAFSLFKLVAALSQCLC
jgi:hypothetical protein